MEGTKNNQINSNTKHPEQAKDPQSIDQNQFKHLRKNAYSEQTGKGDKTYEKMVRYLDIQNSNYDELGELYEKKVVMAVGPTGVGKSTLMNAVIQGRDQMDMDEFARPIVLKQLIYNGKPVFEIGHDAKSCTASPGYCCHKDLYFVDCPGLFDQDRSKEYPNQTAVHLIQKNAKASIILIVFGSSQLTVNRGYVFAEQVTGILRQIGQDCNKEQMKKMLLPVFVNYAALLLPKKLIKQVTMVIEAIDKKWKEKDPAYLDIFQGPTFPLEPEIPQFKMLCEVIKENFICLDPLDTSVGMFARDKKEFKVDEVVDMIKNRFENGMFATPQDYNDDLPLQMFDTLEHEVFLKLPFSQTFFNSKHIRNESEEIFKHIFTPWCGTITEKAKASLKRQIVIADTAARNKIFKWYINKVSPLLVKQAKKESQQSGFKFREGQIDKFPILNLLRHISIKFDLINETDEDKFTFEVWREELHWFQRNYNKMSDEFKSIDFGSRPGQKLNFGQAIQLLRISTLENEQDDKMKEEWTKQSYEKFLLYFKTALPQLFQLRFRRKRVKWMLNIHNNTFKAKMMETGQYMFYKTKNQPANDNVEEEKVQGEDIIQPTQERPPEQAPQNLTKKQLQAIKTEEKKKEKERLAQMAKMEKQKKEEKAKYDKQLKKDGEHAKSEDKKFQELLRKEMKKAKKYNNQDFKNQLALTKFEIFMKMQKGTATLNQVRATSAGVECFAKWIAPHGLWKDDMHDDLLEQMSQMSTAELEQSITLERGNSKLGVSKRSDDADPKPPTTPVLPRRSYFQEVEEDEVPGSGFQHQPSASLIEEDAQWSSEGGSDGISRTRTNTSNETGHNQYGIDTKKYPRFAQKASTYGRDIECQPDQPESLGCLYESLKWMEEKMDQLDLADKDVVVVIGASRSGKGTLLTALKGKKIKFMPLSEMFGEGDGEGDENSESSDYGCVGMLMVAVDEDEVSDSGIISHSSNSHTLAPSIAHGPQYIEEFSALQGHYLIDFAGMFDSKGAEIEIAIDLALQMLIQRAKSTKLGLLVPVNHLLPDSKSIITRTQEKLSFMFQQPSQSVQVIVSKLKMFSEQYSRENILKIASSQEDAVSFKGYNICLAEADEQPTLIEMLSNFQNWPNAKVIAQRGWINPDRIKTLIDAEKTSCDNQHEFDITLSQKIKNAIMKKAGNDRKPVLFEQLKQILKTGDLDQMKVITEEMAKLTKQEMDFWTDIQEIQNVKTILGLVPEYACVNNLVDLGFPAVSKAIYGHEQEILTIVTQILIIGAEGLSQDIGAFTRECSNKEIFIKGDQEKILEAIKDLKQKCDQISDKIHFTVEDKELMKEKMTAVAASVGSGAALAGCSYAYYVGALGLVVGWQIMLIPCALSLAVFISVSISKAKQQQKLKEYSQILAKMVLHNIASLKLQIQVSHKRSHTLNTKIQELDNQINQLITDPAYKNMLNRVQSAPPQQIKSNKGQSEYWDQQVNEEEEEGMDFGHLQRKDEEEKKLEGNDGEYVIPAKPIQNRSEGSTSIFSKIFGGRKSEAKGLGQSQRDGSERRDGQDKKKGKK